MIYKKCISCLFFLLCFCLTNGQEAILCSLQNFKLKIENTIDVPIVTSNNDGTVNLNFPQQYITDIFADYEIYDFNQSFPTGSEELQKYYDIIMNSKDIIEPIITQVPQTTMTIFVEDFSQTEIPLTIPISADLIALLNNNTFIVTKYRTTSDADDCWDCPLYDVPENFNFKVSFNYNTVNDILYMESDEATSCGNSFSIGLKGGNPSGYVDPENMLQLWESYPYTATESNFSEPCHNIEATVFDLLDIACSPYDPAYGNILFTVDSASEKVQFSRSHAFFGEHIVEFSKADLSIDEENLNKMKPYQIPYNPYLLISNSDNQILSVEIINTSGQSVFVTNKFENNSVNISIFEAGLYFIKISNGNDKYKVFKLILN
ncbi:T9SS type A sorting domain-containing protein [Winogradskyella luteola]|uniref:T9SS type A sorting domain-containing protein n=1 Tax=Winogradskyella luteola TaxID=2828330 RepID=A0A9X1F8N5_9FLAO|nr:T9SS type A sorting domain-containing protein [Winogradskyella luteola]MBV7269370.1 T9SS type A sorting domain-containing protein [Winogradskyella luteola]